MIASSAKLNYKAIIRIGQKHCVKVLILEKSLFKNQRIRITNNFFLNMEEICVICDNMLYIRTKSKPTGYLQCARARGSFKAIKKVDMTDKQMSSNLP